MPELAVGVWLGVLLGILAHSTATCYNATGMMLALIGSVFYSFIYTAGLNFEYQIYQEAT